MRIAQKQRITAVGRSAPPKSDLLIQNPIYLPTALRVVLLAPTAFMGFLSSVTSCVHVEDKLGRSRYLVKVSTARARVLCPSRHGKSDEQFAVASGVPDRGRIHTERRTFPGQSALIIDGVVPAEVERNSRQIKRRPRVRALQPHRFAVSWLRAQQGVPYTSGQNEERSVFLFE